MNKHNTRLESLDILRGLDLFFLVAIQPVFMRFAQVMGKESFFYKIFNSLFTHVEWEGFHLWDQVMPLFLFMTGTSIPYAFAKYKEAGVWDKRIIFSRVLKRVFFLWVLGAIVQGNLLSFNLQSLYLYTDTLQAIAAGYLFSVIFYLLFPFRWLIIIFFILPICYTIGMQITGGYLPGENIAEQIDRSILDRFLYGAVVADNGAVIFADWYHISWIYSTLNFTATVISGVIIGYILRTNISEQSKLNYLATAGAVCLILSFGLSFVEPIIKRLWTSSMLFLSSGISIILMLFSYYYIDVKKNGKGIRWLKIYGMNSILAYMLYFTFDTTSLRTFWLHGLKQYFGDFYIVLFEFIHVAIVYLILYYCYRKNIFIKI
ncbi:MAG: acyltransferase family protein [Tannerellaceae bacterium]